jgi:NitT/TauT family transport system permease protein
MSIFTSKKGFFTGTTGILVVLILWYLLALNKHPLILPSPLETWKALKELGTSGDLFTNLYITIKRTLIGYSAAILGGFFLALLLKASHFWQLFFRPLITIIQTIPPVVWIVLAIIWFGIADDITPIFLIFVVTFPVIFINVFSGLQNIDYNLMEMAKVYRCTRKQVLLDIYLPSLIPHLVSATSVGLAFAWKATIFAEFIGSSSGIGFALSMANSNLETEELFAWALVLICLMLLFEYLIIQPLREYVTRWDHYGG